MKRTLLILLTLCILCFGGLAACDKGESNDLYRLYENAGKKLQACGSLHAKMTMDITLKSGENTITMPTTIDMKATDIADADKMTFRLQMTSSVMGQTTSYDVYGKDNYLYFTSEQGNFKIPMTEETGIMTPDDMIPTADLTAELFEGITPEVKDGNTSFTLTVPAAYMDQVLTSMGSVTEDMDGMTISSMTISATINKDGYPLRQEIAFEATMQVQGTATACNAVIRVEYQDPGTSVTVEAPEGYESYDEIAEG